MIPDRALAKIPGRAQYELVQHGAAIRLGGDDPDTFLPEVRSEKWGGRCWLKISHADKAKVGKGKKARDVTHKGRKGVELDLGRVKHRITEGSVKWEIVYSDASDLPADRIVRFQLDYPLDQLTWHYQPALTPEEIAEGHERPENVVDSWAAYWPESGRFLDRDGNEIVNYETGKFAHSYRWLWEAGDGVTCWTHHEIDGAEMQGDCPPQSWLDAHPGPYTLDPTFGYTSEGASASGWLANYGVLLLQATPSSSGTVDSVSVSCKIASSAALKAGVYSDVSGSASSRIGSVGSEVSLPASSSYAWYESSFSSDKPSVSSGTQYYLAQNHSVTNLIVAYDSGSFNSFFKAATYATDPLPSSLTSLSTGYTNRNHSVYATYTATGGGTTVSSGPVGLFDIRALVNSGPVGLFDVRNQVAGSTVGLFDILNRVSSEVAAKYDVLATVASELVCPFDIRATVAGEVIAVFDVRGLVDSEVVGLFDMGGRVSSEIVCLFDIGGGMMVRFDAGRVTLQTYSGQKLKDWTH